MKIYYFTSVKREKHISRFETMHEYTSKKAANAERKALIKDGLDCSEIRERIV